MPTTLEQFNEEVMKEFEKQFVQNLDYSYTGMKNPITIPSWSSNPSKVQNFITQKLTEHKALILKMVREKLLKYERFDTLDCDRIEDHIDEIKNFH